MACFVAEHGELTIPDDAHGVGAGGAAAEASGDDGFG